MSHLEQLFDLGFEAHFHGPVLLAALAGFGLLVGVLTGLFGVGGAFLITPLLNVGFGIPYQLAIGSGLCFTIGTSSSGMRRHLRLGNVELRLTLFLAVTSIVGALLGATLNRSLNLRLGHENYTLVMHSLFVVMLLVTAWALGRGNRQHHTGKSLLQRLPLGPRIDLPAAGLAGVGVPGICAIGMMIGILSGMMGIGGGVVIMPLLILAVGLTPHQAVGTSLGVVMCGSAAGALKYGWHGNVNLSVAMSLLVGSVFGVQIGAWICHRLHAEKLKRYFSVLVLAAACVVAAKLAYSIWRN